MRHSASCPPRERPGAASARAASAEESSASPGGAVLCAPVSRRRPPRGTPGSPEGEAQREIRTWTTKDSAALYNVRRLVERLLPHQRRRQRRGHARGARRSPAIDLNELVDDLQRPRPQPAAPDPLLRHPAHAACEQLVRRLPAAPSREYELPGPLPRRLPDQGEPAAPRGRGAGASTAGPFNLGLEAGSKPELLVGARAAGQPRRAASSATATRTARSSRRRCSPQKLGRQRRSSSSTASASSTPMLAGRAPSSASARHIGVRAQAHHQGRRQVGGVHRRPLEVRPHRRRDRRRRRAACAPRRCSTASQLLHFHIGSQITDDPRASRTPCARPAASTSSCTAWAPSMRYLDVRRRPRRRLRRLARPTSTPR
ncbi:MAG: hypothetical protein MZV63_33440 [Marinilabiliales bacterium]|nr:hypothetical protein [Marinilabiliales bacterium]